MKKKKLNEAIWFDKDENGKLLFNFIMNKFWDNYENSDLINTDQKPIEFISTRFGYGKYSNETTPFERKFSYKNIDKETGDVELGTTKDFNFQFPIYSLFNASEGDKVKIIKDLKEYVKSIDRLDAKKTKEKAYKKYYKKEVVKLDRHGNEITDPNKKAKKYAWRDVVKFDRFYKTLNENTFEAFIYFTVLILCKQFHIGTYENDSKEYNYEQAEILDVRSLTRKNKENTRYRPQCNLVLIPETSSKFMRFIAEFIPIVAPDVTVIQNAFLKADPKDVKILIDTQNRLLPRLNELKEEEEKRNKLKKELDNLQKQWEKDGKITAHGTQKNYLRHFSGLYKLNTNKTRLRNLPEKYSPENPICILDDVCATGTTFRNCYDTLLLAGLDPNAVFGLGIFKTE